jgi:WS/DGAT/MGAT family acyltransferase
MAEGDRLRALDLAWLEMEGDGPPIAIGTVALAEGPVPSAAEVASLIAERSPRMARLHQAIGPTGWGIRRPTWVEAGADEVLEHVHALSAADSAHLGLDATVAWIMQQRLPRDRPLWDAWVVSDIDVPAGRHRRGADSRWALVWRVHHSVADGVGTLLLLGHGFDVDRRGGATMAERVLELQALRAPESGPDPGGPAAPGPEPARTGPDLRAPDSGRPGGILPGLHLPAVHLPDVALGTVHLDGLRVPALGHALDAAGRAIGRLSVAVPSLVPQPPSALTGPVGDGRMWISQDVPLKRVSQVRRAFGVTVNDVVLAGVAGGFRELLLARGESVEGVSVRNLVPVSLRAPGDDTSANELGALLAHLPVGVADPVQRLHDVAAAVRGGKDAGEPLLASALLGLVDRAVPLVLQQPAVASLGRVVPAWFLDTLTTNVPGPQFPIFLMGRAVLAMYPIIPVAGHTAITTGIFSYAGTLNIGVTGDAALAPDVDVLARGVHDAIEDLARRAG